MVNNELIQKSVRLPADLVDYVESCEGVTFTEKLIGILVDYRDGLTSRTKKLKYMRESQEMFSRDLDKLLKVGRSGYRVFMRAEHLIADVEEFNNRLGSVLEDLEDLDSS